METVQKYVIWHEEKYGRQPRDMCLFADFIADDRAEREEWARQDLNGEIVDALAIQSPSLRLLQAVKERRLSLCDITWTQCGDLVAELLANDGFDVRIGKRTKDGGVDIFAERHIDPGGAGFGRSGRRRSSI